MAVTPPPLRKTPKRRRPTTHFNTGAPCVEHPFTDDDDDDEDRTTPTTTTTTERRTTTTTERRTTTTDDDRRRPTDDRGFQKTGFPLRGLALQKQRQLRGKLPNRVSRGRYSAGTGLSAALWLSDSLQDEVVSWTDECQNPLSCIKTRLENPL